MPYLLKDLVIDRVDLVDEGANSAAFIELFKRKEQDTNMNFEEILKKMKTEHAEVITSEMTGLSKAAEKATEDLDTTKAELEKVKEELKTAKEKLMGKKEEDEEEDKKDNTPEGVIKSMPKDVQALFSKMKQQKETAEEQVRKAKEAEKHAEAVSKAAELKALPIEKDKLVDILKKCDTDMIDVFTSINTAIEDTVLKEKGKSTNQEDVNKGADAWAKIEKKATEVSKRDSSTKQKAIATVIKENPELYKEYLEGGSN